MMTKDDDLLGSTASGNTNDPPSTPNICAVLVDGVGNTREMALRHESPSICVPIHQRMAMAIDNPPMRVEPHIVDFQRLGSLPDGRVVYGYPFSSGGYALWYVSGSWAAGSYDRTIQAVAEEMGRNLDAIGVRPPIVRLFDRVEPDAARLVMTRTIWGVGRRDVDGGHDSQQQAAQPSND